MRWVRGGAIADLLYSLQTGGRTHPTSARNSRPQQGHECSHVAVERHGASADSEGPGTDDASTVTGKPRMDDPESGMNDWNPAGSYPCGTRPAVSGSVRPELVERAGSGVSKAVLARDYGISRETVYQYLRHARLE